MKFYKNALITACIVLLIILAIIASMLLFSKKKKVFPPVISECPDYWIDVQYLKSPEGKKYLNDPLIIDAVNMAQNKTDCINFKKIGSCTNDPSQLIVDPNSFQGGDGIYAGSKMCSQFQWASGCDLTWDGITNRDNICGYPKKNHY